MPHPLDPVQPEELLHAVTLLKSHFHPTPIKFNALDLYEPDRSTPNNKNTRQLHYIITTNNNNNNTFDHFTGILDLTSCKILSKEKITQGKPCIQFDECAEIENLVRSDTRVITALSRRGIHLKDPSLLMVDAGTVGNFSLPYEHDPSNNNRHRRLSQALLFLRHSPTDNGYARPIDGLIPIIDIDKLEIVAIEDHDDHIPIAHQPSNYSTEFLKTKQWSPCKPLQITQPLGPSFTIKDTYNVNFANWTFRVGFNAREGLTLHNIQFLDRTTNQPRNLFHRLSVSEMVVPYGDPRDQHFRKNAFDAGEYYLGRCANSLKLGCDCLGLIHYFDAHWIDSRGNIITTPNAICLHEEDHGILWKHTDWRTNATETRRSRRLVISFFTTIANYEYGFYWYFYLDGTIQFEAKLTGIINVGMVDERIKKMTNKPEFGELVAPDGVYGVHHQHFFCIRMDTCIDGSKNTIYESNTSAIPITDPINKYKNGFKTSKTVIKSEADSGRQINPFTNRYWVIANRNSLNPISGSPVGYKLEIPESSLPFADATAPVRQRAGFLGNNIWVTRYRRHERFPTGEVPNQHPGGDGIPRFVERDESVVDSELVVWINVGKTHICRVMFTLLSI